MTTINADHRSDLLRHGAKSVIAALVTWQLIALWLPGQQQFLGVASALLTANASTVYRSVVHAVRRVAIQVSGVSLAVAAAWLFGATAGGIVVVLVVVVVTGGRRNGEDRLQVASTALITLTAAAAAPFGNVAFSAVATFIGTAVGVTVNALILPPTYLDRSTAAVLGLARSIGALLHDMSRGLAEGRCSSQARIWLERGRRLEQQVDEARDEVRKALESLRWNTRAAARGHRASSAHEDVLDVLHTASYQVRGIARTLADHIDQEADHALGHTFAARYANVLNLAARVFTTYADTGRARNCAQADARKQLRAAIERTSAWHAGLTDLVERGALGEADAWHVHGSLIVDVERLLADLDRADAA